MSLFRKSHAEPVIEPAVFDTNAITFSLYGEARDVRSDGLSGLTLTATELIEVMPVIGETVTITFRVTGIERQERA